jgi:hypothetical protein
MKKLKTIITILIILFCLLLSITTMSSVYHEDLYNIQKKLKKLGYNPGPVEGFWVEETGDAIKKFQQDNGLSATGELDEGTLKKLGLHDIWKKHKEGGLSTVLSGYWNEIGISYSVSVKTKPIGKNKYGETVYPTEGAGLPSVFIGIIKEPKKLIENGFHDVFEGDKVEILFIERSENLPIKIKVKVLRTGESNIIKYDKK